jgi:hypothetical protein
MTVTANVVAAQHIFYTGGRHHVSVTASTGVSVTGSLGVPMDSGRIAEAATVPG